MKPSPEQYAAITAMESQHMTHHIAGLAAKALVYVVRDGLDAIAKAINNIDVCPK